MTGGCAAGSAQELWLKADLAANSSKNVIALWHKPRYSSGITNYQTLQPLWDDLYAAGVDILLVGHDHVYERFVPIKSGATLAEPAGGRPDLWHPRVHGRHRRRSAPRLRHPVRDQRSARPGRPTACMKLTLHATTYDWEFLPDRRRHLHRLGHGHRPCRAPATVPGTPTIGTATPATPRRR